MQTFYLEAAFNTAIAQLLENKLNVSHIIIKLQTRQAVQFPELISKSN